MKSFIMMMPLLMAMMILCLLSARVTRPSIALAHCLLSARVSGMAYMFFLKVRIILIIEECLPFDPYLYYVYLLCLHPFLFFLPFRYDYLVGYPGPGIFISLPYAFKSIYGQFDPTRMDGYPPVFTFHYGATICL